MKTFTKIMFTYIVIAFGGCSGSPATAGLINGKASLPSSFNFSKLGLKVMATFINKKKGTMATLFANPVALDEEKAGRDKRYGGKVFALITWQQQADSNWFGAKIPGLLQSVEILSLPAENDESGTIKYTRYKGKNLIPDPDTLDRNERMSFILSQKPSVMP